MKVKAGIYFDGAYYCYAKKHFYNKNRCNIQIKKLIYELELFLIGEYLTIKKKVAKEELNIEVKRYSNSINKKLKASLYEKIILKECDKLEFEPPYINSLVNGKQKGIDVEIAFNIGKDIIKNKLNLIILVASDTDFKPILENLKDTKIKTCIFNLSNSECSTLKITDLYKSADFTYNFWENENVYKKN